MNKILQNTVVFLRVRDFSIRIETPILFEKEIRNAFLPFIASGKIPSHDVIDVNIVEYAIDSQSDFYDSIKSDETKWVYKLTNNLVISVDWNKTAGCINLFETQNVNEILLAVYGIINLFIKSKLAKNHSMVSIHAATFYTRDGAALLSAESGGGKSTLSFLLNAAGYKYLGDEDAMLIEESGSQFIFPFFRRLCVDSRIFELIDNDIANRFYRSPCECFGQKQIAVSVATGPLAGNIPLEAIIFMEKLPRDESYEFIKVSSSDAMRFLLQSYEPIPADSYGTGAKTFFKGYNRRAFEIVERISEIIPVYKIRYDISMHLKEVIADVEKRFPKP